MGKVFHLIGKSASGKDSLFDRLLEEPLGLHPIVLYTTRPRRDFEHEGVEYHFVSPQRMKELENQGKIIEQRTYQTVHGPWTYATVDQDLHLDRENYLAIGTLESYLAFRSYFGEERVVPLYVEVEDGVRLQRALDREKERAHPDYNEMCRRFLSDQEDFSEEKLKEAGIVKRYQNEDFETCLVELSFCISQAV